MYKFLFVFSNYFFVCRYRLGDVYREMGNHDRARAVYAQALVCLAVSHGHTHEFVINLVDQLKELSK